MRRGRASWSVGIVPQLGGGAEGDWGPPLWVGYKLGTLPQGGREEAEHPRSTTPCRFPKAPL